MVFILLSVIIGVVLAIVLLSLTASVMVLAMERLALSPQQQLGYVSTSSSATGTIARTSGMVSEPMIMTMKANAVPPASAGGGGDMFMMRDEAMVESGAVYGDTDPAFGHQGAGRRGAPDEDAFIGVSDSDTIGVMVLEALRSSDKNESHNIVDRMLIHDGSMELQCAVADMDFLADRVAALAKDKGKGYVESRSKAQESRWDYDTAVGYNRETKYWYIHMQLRVANGRFHEIMSDIQQLVGGDQGVLSIYTNSQDVTDQYIDAKARADTLDASRRAIEKLLARAENVHDVMQVQRELNSLTQQLESQRKRAISLKQLADYSRMGISIREKIVAPSSEETSTLWDPLKTAWRALSHVQFMAQFASDAVIYAFVWALPISIIVLIVTAIWGKHGDIGYGRV